MRNNLTPDSGDQADPLCPICSDEKLPAFKFSDADAIAEGIDPNHPLVHALRAHAETVTRFHEFKRGLPRDKFPVLKAQYEDMLHQMSIVGEVMSKLVEIHGKAK